jgi:hypothetical protein
VRKIGKRPYVDNVAEEFEHFFLSGKLSASEYTAAFATHLF